MQIKKTTKTSVAASDKQLAKCNLLSTKAAFMRNFLAEEKGYSRNQVNGMGLRELKETYLKEGGDSDALYSSTDVKSSTSTDKALKHIKAAIDILATENSEIAKDSIANLATVMFDIKGSTKIDK